MSGMSSLCVFKFTAIQVAEVISCTATERRALVERGVAKELSETLYYGKWSCNGSIVLVFDKADQTKIEDQIAAAGASAAVEITWAAGAVWSGLAKFSDYTIEYSNGQYVQASANFASDGAWLINGRNTETLAGSST